MFHRRIHIWHLMFLLAIPGGSWLAASTAMAAEVSIVSPGKEETVHNNSGNVTVEVQAELDRGERIRLLIDGSPAAPDSTEPKFELQGINRGEHTLKALVLDGGENVIAESEPIVFYMWQASRQFPNRAQ